MNKLTHFFALALSFVIFGSCSTPDPTPLVLPVVSPVISSGTTAIVPDDGLIHTQSEAKEISSFLRYFYGNKLTYSIEEPIPEFSSKIPGSSGEAITSGSIVVTKNMGVLEEYKATFETDFNKYADSGFIINGSAARYEIFSYTLDGNSIASTSLYVEFEFGGRKIKDTIDLTYSFMEKDGLSYYMVQNSFNKYTWNEP